MTTHLFCEKCEKVISESETKDISILGIVPKVVHYYSELYNASNSRYATDLQTRFVRCGAVREPTAEEYFIFHTCKFKE